MNTYQIDSEVTLSTLFTASDGVTPIDPTTVTLYIVAPDGTEMELTGSDLAHPSTGSFSYGVLVNQSGIWIYKWQGAGAVDVTTPDTYLAVQESVPLPG
jgi:hypothetical protein